MAAGMRKIVLDTNCLLSSLSRRGKYFNVWRGMQEGKFTLCVSTDILEEYQEIIEQKTTAVIASNVIQTLLNLPNVEFITPYYHFRWVLLIRFGRFVRYFQNQSGRI